MRQLIALITLLCASSLVQAQDNRYFNIQQATHISDGWVAYSNGELYHCQFSESSKDGSPNCVRATGLPSSFHKAELLSANGNEAWISYTDGHVYGCRMKQQSSPHCTQAAGLP